MTVASCRNLLFMAAALAGCQPNASHVEPKEPPMSLDISSSAFAHNHAIPRKHTGEGDDLSPPLAWKGIPPGAAELALICDDPDAPRAEPWVHWVIFRIPADCQSLPEGLPGEPELTSPVPAAQGQNSWTQGKTIGYRGPMPPPGHGTHHYRFTLYALAQKLDLKPGASKQELLAAMRGHIVAQGLLTGTYERK